MLSKQKRLSKANFQKILKVRPFFITSPIFSLRYGSSGTKGSQFSCVVSKKAIKGAVERNRARRRCYGVISGLYKHIKGGYFGVFSLKKEISKCEYKYLKEEIEKALKKAEILENS